MGLQDYTSEELSLVALLPEHAKAIHGYASKPFVKKYIGWPLMRTEEETHRYVAMLISRHEGGSHIYASVQEKATGRIVGTAMIFNFDREANHAEIGYVLDDTIWDRGYGTQVVQLLTDYTLRDLGMRKIFARTVDANVGSSRVLEKNGYKLEAELKDYYYIEGNYLSCKFFSRCPDGTG